MVTIKHKHCSCHLDTFHLDIFSIYCDMIWPPSNYHGLTLIPAWIDNHMPSKVWVMPYPIQLYSIKSFYWQIQYLTTIQKLAKYIFSKAFIFKILRLLFVAICAYGPIRACEISILCWFSYFATYREGWKKLDVICFFKICNPLIYNEDMPGQLVSL